MGIINIFLKGQLLIKYYLIKHLILLKYDGLQGVLASKFFLIEILLRKQVNMLLLTQEQELILIQILRTKNQQKNYTRQFLENLRYGIFILSGQDLETLLLIRMNPETFKRLGRGKGGRGGTLCRPPWLAREENVRFQMV